MVLVHRMIFGLLLKNEGHVEFADPKRARHKGAVFTVDFLDKNEFMSKEVEKY